MKNNKKGFANPVLVIIIFVFIVAVGYLVFINSLPCGDHRNPLAYLVSCAKPQTVKDTVTNTSNWKTYTNDKHGFQIQLPSDWEVREEKDKTIFNSPETVKAVNDLTQRIISQNLDTDGYVQNNLAIIYVDDMVGQAYNVFGKILNSNNPPSAVSKPSYDTLQKYIELTGLNLLYTPFARSDAFHGRESEMDDSDVIYVEKNNHLYVINSAINSNGMDLQLNYQILSTFKFTK